MTVGRGARGVLLMAVVGAGCAGVRTKPQGARALEKIAIGCSVRGTPIEAHVLPGSEPGILMIGGIHGDEAVGTTLLDAFEALVSADPALAQGRRIVLVPRANPDGLAAGTRWNAHGVDANRNFPAPNFSVHVRHGKEACSEPEARAIVDLLASQRFALVIAIHAPLRCIDYDGEAAKSIAEALSVASKLPLRHLGGLPGSLGTYAGVHLGLRMVTYELDRRRAPRANVARYLAPHVEALRAALAAIPR